MMHGGNLKLKKSPLYYCTSKLLLIIINKRKIGIGNLPMCDEDRHSLHNINVHKHEHNVTFVYCSLASASSPKITCGLRKHKLDYAFIFSIAPEK
jgi:hypothetical protein